MAMPARMKLREKARGEPEERAVPELREVLHPERDDYVWYVLKERADRAGEDPEPQGDEDEADGLGPPEVLREEPLVGAEAPEGRDGKAHPGAGACSAFPFRLYPFLFFSAHAATLIKDIKYGRL